jgi:hypothetical protein
VVVLKFSKYSRLADKLDTARDMALIANAFLVSERWGGNLIIGMLSQGSVFNAQFGAHGRVVSGLNT